MGKRGTAGLVAKVDAEVPVHIIEPLHIRIGLSGLHCSFLRYLDVLIINRFKAFKKKNFL